VRVPLKKLDISGNQQLGNQSLRGKRSRGANDFGDKSIIVCCGAAAFQTYLSRRAAVAASLLVWTFRGDELFYDYFLLLLGRLISIFLFSLLAYLGSSLYIYFIFPSMFVIWLNCCCCCCSQRWTITPVGIASSDLSSWQTSCVHFVSPPLYKISRSLFFMGFKLIYGPFRWYGNRWLFCRPPLFILFSVVTFRLDFWNFLENKKRQQNALSAI
jgi:hypothetical protein